MFKQRLMGLVVVLAGCSTSNPDFLSDGGVDLGEAPAVDAQVLRVDSGADAALPDAQVDGAVADSAVVDGAVADAEPLDAAPEADQGPDAQLVDLGVDAAPDLGPVDGDGDGVFGDEDCDDDNAQVFPGAVERCDGVDNDCDGLADEGFEGLGAACSAGLGACLTRGFIVCTGAADVGCSAEAGAPSAEVCNQIDDDCNGQVDDGVAGCGCVPEVEVCNGRDDNCDGFVDEGLLNACGACGPVADEVCNGVDDNCDGQADEGVTNACGACGAVPAEVCNGRDDDCDGVVDDGVLNACGACGAVPAEVCNGLDDDCNGQVDDLAERACNGTCGVGTQACVDGAWGVCQGPFPGVETCNGLDDDCDGSVDENLVRACATPCGAGEQRCDVGQWAECVPPAGVVEQCNFIDDDCDGEVDEGVLNACGGCGPVPVEQCNFVDDDCDGVVDEGLRNACDQCGPAPVEVCNGVDDNCDGVVDEGLRNACDQCGPVPVEVCNGQDDNCDGEVDEGLLNACGDCGPLPVEVCNGLDEDCDGQADEGLAELCIVPVGSSAAPEDAVMLGSTLVATGDLDGDGVPDAASAGPEDTDTLDGGVYGISGADGRLLWGYNEPGRLGVDLAWGDVMGSGAAQVCAGIPDAPSANQGEGGLRFLNTAGALATSVGAAEDANLGVSIDVGSFGGRDAVIVGEPNRSGAFVFLPVRRVGRVVVVRFDAAGGLETVFDVGGWARDDRLGERVHAVPDLNGDGFAEVIATWRDGDDRSTELLNGADGARMGTLEPPVETERTFGQAVITGRFAADGSGAFAFGAHRARVQDVRRTGAVWVIAGDGEVLDRLAVGAENEQMGYDLAWLPRPAHAADVLVVGTLSAGRVELHDRASGRIVGLVDGNERTFGRSVAVSGPAADGTWRLFVGEPGFANGAGRVLVYSVR